MNDDRLTQIETKLAFAEQANAELSELVYAQQKQIERLEALCSALGKRVAALDGDAAGGDSHEVPPHY